MKIRWGKFPPQDWASIENDKHEEYRAFQWQITSRCSHAAIISVDITRNILKTKQAFVCAALGGSSDRLEKYDTLGMKNGRFVCICGSCICCISILEEYIVFFFFRICKFIALCIYNICVFHVYFVICYNRDSQTKNVGANISDTIVLNC